MIKVEFIRTDPQYGEWKKGDKGIIVGTMSLGEHPGYIVIHLLENNRDVLVDLGKDAFYKITNL